MNKLRTIRIALIGLLLAGAVALVGCSRYETAREGQMRGRSSELAGRSLEQEGRGRSDSTMEQGRGGAERSGGFGRQQENLDAAGERLGRAGSGLNQGGGSQWDGRLGGSQGGRGLEGRNQGNLFQVKGSDATELSGKTIVEMGSISNLNGTLSYDGSEWFLETSRDTYMLHFGNHDYVDSTGIDLHEGDSIDVRGFVSGEEIAVVSARLNSQVYTFRSENGIPMWAGQGRGDNRVAQPYGNGAGSDQRRGQGGQGQGPRDGERVGGQGSRDGMGRGQGSGNGTFDRQGPGSGNGLPEDRGRGRGLEDSQEYPWWYQQPLEPESSQPQA